LYVKFHEEADHDDSLNDEARSWVVKMQDGSEEGLTLWRWFNEISMLEYNRIYKLLNVDFDIVNRGESYYNDKMAAVADELLKKGLLVESDGAKIVNLDAYDMPPCLILRRDGGTLYPTRDIAAAIDRYETFRFDQSLYVVASEQNLHISQFMKVVELMGYPWAKDMRHISFGMLTFEDGKFSTRRGNAIKIIDLIDEAVEKTLAIIQEKNPDLPGKEKVAEQVGVGALVFNKLYNSRVKDTVFSWERTLNFDGETGPYVQYTHARACSVLGKKAASSKTSKPKEPDISGFFPFDGALLSDAESFDVIRLLYDFPARIREAAEKYEPFIIARHTMALAQAFNAFYHQHTVLVEDEILRNARLALTEAVRKVLETGLKLLGIQTPKKM
jgi:arginyl-tRNA synthetase